MYSLRRAASLAILAILALLGPAAGDEAALPSPPRAGRFVFSLRSDRFDRTAHVQIPKGFDAGAKPPLVLALHGAGGTGTGMLDHNGWAAKADSEGFIAVAPDGLPARPERETNFRTNPALWNSGQLRPNSPRVAVDDVAYLCDLLDQLKEKVPYDLRRVFCTGHSNGGAMTFLLAAKQSERFAAIGTVAGMMSVEDPAPVRPLPTLYILGTKDPLMPIDGGPVKLPWGSRENPPVAEPLAVWAEAIDCETEPKTVSETDGVKTVEYPSKSHRPTLTVMYLEGQGHHWPGGTRLLPERLIGPSTTSLNATDVLWEFFQGHGGKYDR